MMLVYAAFAMGLLGSMHCLGMCGPIAMALPVRTRHVGIKTAKYLLYNAGRILTYSVLGAIIGLVGKGFVFAGLQQALSIGAGFAIILSVAVIHYPFEKWMTTNMISPIQYKIKQAFTYYFQHPNGSGLLVLGLLNGLLPCGMVYAACFGALASGNALSGALFMMAFGVGTVPLMLTASFAGHAMGHQWRQLFNKLSPVLTVAIGALLILRGLQVHVPEFIPVAFEKSIYTCH
ncbi:MAG: hypothetical protein JWO58_2930 [Chitinophagaceae bacterium]|nr:hypothetical protein [Chitinophagaceae bacterium]